MLVMGGGATWYLYSITDTVKHHAAWKVITADRPRTKEYRLTTAGMQPSLSFCHLCESRGTAIAATHCHPLRISC